MNMVAPVHDALSSSWPLSAMRSQDALEAGLGQATDLDIGDRRAGEVLAPRVGDDDPTVAQDGERRDGGEQRLDRDEAAG